ncbi:hypothetical protein PD885_03964 [Xanthomonas fragariae]|uniref:Uncharacterized protein n=1 Tax=Xanthomonas fragariae TaxID=48664 RepID=A0ABY1RV63_9XANT|nr:hypothetical protein NBC2815_03925 [Xanthomonas fragariae]SMR01178.1 hypothetical protein PD885_03964 [Xanthomonas fragariae]
MRLPPIVNNINVTCVNIINIQSFSYALSRLPDLTLTWQNCKTLRLIIKKRWPA